jgi:hypothetical protein
MMVMGGGLASWRADLRTRSDDCSTDFFWTFGSVPQITFSNPDFSGKIKSFKCWKAGAYQGYD